MNEKKRKNVSRHHRHRHHQRNSSKNTKNMKLPPFDVSIQNYFHFFFLKLAALLLFALVLLYIPCASAEAACWRRSRSRTS
jgi:hypothetical protein